MPSRRSEQPETKREKEKERERERERKREREREREWNEVRGRGKEKFSYRLADKGRKTSRIEGVARHLSGTGKRHDGISEIALDIFTCIAIYPFLRGTPTPCCPSQYLHLRCSFLFSPVEASTMPAFLLVDRSLRNDRNTLEFIGADTNRHREYWKN